MKNFNILVSANVLFLTAVAMVLVLIPESFVSCYLGTEASLRVSESTRLLGLGLGAVALVLSLVGAVTDRSSLQRILLTVLVIAGGVAQLAAFYVQNHLLQSEAGFLLLVSVTLINVANVLGLIRSLVLPTSPEVVRRDERSDVAGVGLIVGPSFRSFLLIAGVLLVSGWIAPEAFRDFLAPEESPASILLGAGGLLALGGLLSWGIALFEARDRRALEQGTQDRWLRQIAETVASEERNRLARELHDSIKQQMFSIKMSSAAVAERWSSDREGARKSLDDVRRCAHEAMVEMQALLLQLRPEALVNIGLVEALEEQCEALQYRTGANVRCEVGDLPPESDLPPNIQQTLFRIAQEMLSNVSRHARATRVDLCLRQEGRELVLSVEDDGQGFEPGESAAGFGLKGIRERVGEFDGAFDLVSSPGAGARVEVRIPLDAALAASSADLAAASSAVPGPTIPAAFSPAAIVALCACLAPMILPQTYFDPQAAAALSWWLSLGFLALAAAVAGCSWFAKRRRGGTSRPSADVTSIRLFLLLATAFWWSPQFWMPFPRGEASAVVLSSLYSVSVGLLAALPAWQFLKSRGSGAHGRSETTAGSSLVFWLLLVAAGSLMPFAGPDKLTLVMTAALGGASTVVAYLGAVTVLWWELRARAGAVP